MSKSVPPISFRGAPFCRLRNVTTEDGKPLVSFAYASRALAEAAATHLESALLNAISVHPYAE
jgi:hypothetical protein